MTLTNFTDDNYDLLIRWINSEELNYLWGGPTFEFPLTREQLSEHFGKPEVTPYIFVVDDKQAGFVERYKVSEDHYRICRVFIADEFRGQSLSSIMLRALISNVKEIPGCTRLSLAVYAHNTAAIACYKSLGFEIIATESGSISCNGETWDLLRMAMKIP
ncbi:GNAT family N-acetyltransferase [Vibrio sp. JC009]|uniref:GNAT family N-acetyltransferase n=1 Tax=Vibrio sp. JC009 TaxID=2912314 RepID=UPI0023AF8B8E|nr:GNAT family protein [Vibrio sp. JC009]WED23249.1 GNAT family N-acetyltransferase [Vibrio sp. JC009]